MTRKPHVQAATLGGDRRAGSAKSEERSDRDRLRPERYSSAQLRTVAVAMELFADHGVTGTSLQMIADGLGVTKAAVYHQFKTKEAIVVAVAEVGMTPLQTALEEASAHSHTETARALLLERVVDLAVTRRRWAIAIQGDPVMDRILTQPPFVGLLNRVYALLMGEELSPAVAVRAALLAAAVGGAVASPLVAEVDDDTLRTELLSLTRRVFDLPG